MTPSTSSSSALPIRAAGKTHPGLVRRRNEDRLLMAPLGARPPRALSLPSEGEDGGAAVLECRGAVGVDGFGPAEEGGSRGASASVPEAPVLLLVADGMGGAVGGAEAARMAALALHQALSARIRNSHEPGGTAATLLQATQLAHREIRRRGWSDLGLRGMGTTLTAALVEGDALHLVQVGDSRALLLRDGILTQLTRDQSMVQDMVDSGVLTPEQARSSPHRNVILQALGGEDPLEPVGGRHPLRPGDRLLLCTDGLTGVVPPEPLRSILEGENTPAAACDALVEATLRGGAPDNVTCIVADLGAVDPSSGDPDPDSPSRTG